MNLKLNKTISQIEIKLNCINSKVEYKTEKKITIHKTFKKYIKLPYNYTPKAVEDSHHPQPLDCV